MRNSCFRTVQKKTWPRRTVLATHLVPLPHWSTSRALTWVWSCHVPYTRHLPQANILWHPNLKGWFSRRGVLVSGGLEVASVASWGLSMGAATSNPMFPASATWVKHGEAAAIKHAGRMLSLVLRVHLEIGLLWLLTQYFSSSFMIIEDNQGSWKPGIFVPFTLFVPQAPKTLSQCPRGPLPFRENV